MPAHRYVSDLFNPEPHQWGFLGNPYLWQDMAAQLSGTSLPDSEQVLVTLLEAMFEQLVGAPLSSPKSLVFVERFSHGGMSSGRVSLAFWRDTGIPLLTSGAS